MSGLAFEGSVASAFASVEERADEMVSEDMLSGLQLGLNSAVERQLKQLALEFGMRVVEMIAEEYELDAKEIIAKIGLDKVEVKRVKMTRKADTSTDGKKSGASKWEKPSIVLPWTGERYSNDKCCLGIRKNYGLYSQCVMKRVGDSIYCSTCKKQADKNETGKPTCGDVYDRDEQGVNDTYMPPGAEKEVSVASYGNVVQKLIKAKPEKASMYLEESVKAEAEKFGITINESHFDVAPKKKAGRPKKSDSEGEEESSMVEKAKKTAKTNKNTKQSKAKKTTKSDEEEEADDTEEVSADIINDMIAKEAGYDVEDDVEEVEEVPDVEVSDVESVKSKTTKSKSTKTETKTTKTETKKTESKKDTKKDTKKESKKKVDKPVKFKYDDKKGNVLGGKAYTNGKIKVIVEGCEFDLADMNYTFKDGHLYDENDVRVSNKYVGNILETIKEQMNCEESENDSDEE